MVEKENLTPGFPFEPLFRGIRSQEFVALIADTLLFIVVGVLSLLVILSMRLDFNQSTSLIIIGVAALGALLVILLYIAARRSMKTVKHHGE